MVLSMPESTNIDRDATISENLLVITLLRRNYNVMDAELLVSYYSSLACRPIVL